jgi:septal ring factor EnvC (AmiA/AmiB activator)
MIRRKKLDMINVLYLLISFVNVMGENEKLKLESDQLLSQLEKAPETKDEEVLTQQAVESDSEATAQYRASLRKNTEDLTNKIPCLDKSAKYRARPEKVRTVGSFIKSGPFFVSVG